mgnify:CR=1 FL=1
MSEGRCYVRMGSSSLAIPYVQQITARAGTEMPAVVDLDFIDKELEQNKIIE